VAGATPQYILEGPVGEEESNSNIPIKRKKGKGKTFNLKQNMKAQRGSKVIVLTFDFGAGWGHC